MITPAIWGLVPSRRVPVLCRCDHATSAPQAGQRAGAARPGTTETICAQLRCAWPTPVTSWAD